MKRKKRQKQQASDPYEASDHRDESASEAEAGRPQASKNKNTSSCSSGKDVGALQSRFRGEEAKADDSETARHAEAIRTLRELTGICHKCDGPENCGPDAVWYACMTCKGDALDAAASPAH